MLWPMSRRRLAVLIVVLVLGAGALAAFRTPAGPASMRGFEPDRLAQLELDMWRAYYSKQRLVLFRLLLVMLREQYHYSWAIAAREGFHLARAASTFGEATSNYESALPDLEAGYATAKAHLGAGFDPAAVARAELAWWVARRIPGQNSPEQVGLLMAYEYSLLYEVPQSRVEQAAYLRAKAGRLRDETATQPDWNVIQDLLQQSYRELKTAVAK